ncbi:hypothetical protein J6R97_04090 [bacterium]|nr:hypothetical protein [bacterium]
MSTIKANNLSKVYKNEYSAWRDQKELNALKRQEYLRRNPDEISDYDLQRAKILLNSFEIMDKSSKSNSNKIGVAFETATNLGLGYAAVGGATLGYFATKLKFIEKNINKVVEKYPTSKKVVSMGITMTSGILGILTAYPAYKFLSKIESKIHRKRKFETMEKELQDPRNFVVLDEEQRAIFFQNLPSLDEIDKKVVVKENLSQEIKSIIQTSKEILNHENERDSFGEKYKNDKTLYNIPLTEKEIKNAKKDKVLLNTLIKEVNLKSQSYTERIKRITDNLITISFALASLFTLGYERLAKTVNLKSSSVPVGIGIATLAGSTFFANWAQRRASHVGKFKAIQELKQNPEQLVYISKHKIETIDDEEIELENRQKINTIKFLKEFFAHNKEYKDWKKSNSYTGADISKAMDGIEISPEQLRDGKRLQRNLFKTLYKVEKNTQNYSNEIDIMGESIKYPMTLMLGSLGSVLGMKHLINLRKSSKSVDVIKNSTKYIGTITLFTLPLLILNSYFAKAQKMGARISDMVTMKNMEDYRFFADYSPIE